LPTRECATKIKSSYYLDEELPVRLASIKASPYNYLYSFKGLAALAGFDLVHKNFRTRYSITGGHEVAYQG